MCALTRTLGALSRLLLVATGAGNVCACACSGLGSERLSGCTSGSHFWHKQMRCILCSTRTHTHRHSDTYQVAALEADLKLTAVAAIKRVARSVCLTTTVFTLAHTHTLTDTCTHTHWHTQSSIEINNSQ